MKHPMSVQVKQRDDPAAFGRLCVETKRRSRRLREPKPAAFGRLCVETMLMNSLKKKLCLQPPSGGCVLKLPTGAVLIVDEAPAAFGRLCVETFFCDKECY